jgi:hypothetical protein
MEWSVFGLLGAVVDGGIIRLDAGGASRFIKMI